MKASRKTWLRVVSSILMVLIILTLPLMSWADNPEQRIGHTKATSESVSVAGIGIASDTGLQTEDLTSDELTAQALAQALVGEGVAIDPDSVVYTGADLSAGTFSGGTDIIGFESGIILSSGWVSDVVGPNTSPSTSRAMGTPGDDDLTELSGFSTYDAAILEFTFDVGPYAEKVFFQYVFGSEEYNEYVGSPFNDVFAFFVNGVNYAVVPDPNDPSATLPVSINTINNGGPYWGADPTNPHLYINNDPFHIDSTESTVPEEDLLNTEMDGLTVVLYFEAPVNPGTNTMRLAIADASDAVLDSWVFIKKGSLTTVPPEPDIQAVAIDIRPQSCPNPFNVTQRGVLPVAILGTASFDVAQVDASTVRLEGVEPLRWALEDVATPYTDDFSDPPSREDCTTEGPDGFMDLSLKFDSQEVVAALGEVEDGDVMLLQLTGQLMDGTPIVGEDVIWIIKKSGGNPGGGPVRSGR